MIGRKSAAGQNTKKVLLIGSSGVLGSAFVERSASRYQIIGVARHSPPNASLLFDFIQADASWEWERIIGTVLERHTSVDVLINNAVYYDLVPLIEKKIHHLSTELQTNVAAPFAFSQELLLKSWSRSSPEENRQKNRSIINIGSMSGVNIYPHIKQGTYSATKAALHMLTLHMAAEWQTYGIRVNGMAFGRIGGNTSFEFANQALVDFIEGKQNALIETVSGSPKE